MLLKELQPGKRFMFSDKKTPVALITKKGQFPPVGVFVYVRNGEGTCPVLRHETTNSEIVAVPNTYFRDVLIIL